VSGPIAISAIVLHEKPVGLVINIAPLRFILALVPASESPLLSGKSYDRPATITMLGANNGGGKVVFRWKGSAGGPGFGHPWLCGDTSAKCPLIFVSSMRQHRHLNNAIPERATGVVLFNISRLSTMRAVFQQARGCSDGISCSSPRTRTALWALKTWNEDRRI
jgi:hypothetical protein